MERACFLLRVKKGLIEQYRQAHASVWPELLRTMREFGIHNYSMFLRKDGLVVGYLEATNIKQSLAKVSATEISQRWEEKMAPYFEEGYTDFEEGGIEWLEQCFYAP